MEYMLQDDILQELQEEEEENHVVVAAAAAAVAISSSPEDLLFGQGIPRFDAAQVVPRVKRGRGRPAKYPGRVRARGGVRRPRGGGSESGTTTTTRGSGSVAGPLGAAGSSNRGRRGRGVGRPRSRQTIHLKKKESSIDQMDTTTTTGRIHTPIYTNINTPPLHHHHHHHHTSGHHHNSSHHTTSHHHTTTTTNSTNSNIHDTNSHDCLTTNITCFNTGGIHTTNMGCYTTLPTHRQQPFCPYTFFHPTCTTPTTSHPTTSHPPTSFSPPPAAAASACGSSSFSSTGVWLGKLSRLLLHHHPDDQILPPATIHTTTTTNTTNATTTTTTNAAATASSSRGIIRNEFKPGGVVHHEFCSSRGPPSVTSSTITTDTKREEFQGTNRAVYKKLKRFSDHQHRKMQIDDKTNHQLFTLQTDEPKGISYDSKIFNDQHQQGQLAKFTTSTSRSKEPLIRPTTNFRNHPLGTIRKRTIHNQTTGGTSAAAGGAAFASLATKLEASSFSFTNNLYPSTNVPSTITTCTTSTDTTYNTSNNNSNNSNNTSNNNSNNTSNNNSNNTSNPSNNSSNPSNLTSCTLVHNVGTTHPNPTASSSRNGIFSPTTTTTAGLVCPPTRSTYDADVNQIDNTTMAGVPLTSTMPSSIHTKATTPTLSSTPPPSPSTPSLPSSSSTNLSNGVLPPDIFFSSRSRTLTGLKQKSEGDGATKRYIHVGSKYQVPSLPPFFLTTADGMEESDSPVPYLSSNNSNLYESRALLLYSPDLLESTSRERMRRGEGHRVINNEQEMKCYVAQVALNWKQMLGWQPFSTEYAYKLLHAAHYDPERALWILNSPSLDFEALFDPPTRKYENKWKPRDRRGEIPMCPFPPDSTTRVMTRRYDRFR